MKFDLEYIRYLRNMDNPTWTMNYLDVINNSLIEKSGFIASADRLVITPKGIRPSHRVQLNDKVIKVTELIIDIPHDHDPVIEREYHTNIEAGRVFGMMTGLNPMTTAVVNELRFILKEDHSNELEKVIKVIQSTTLDDVLRIVALLKSNVPKLKKYKV